MVVQHYQSLQRQCPGWVYPLQAWARDEQGSYGWCNLLLLFPSFPFAFFEVPIFPFFFLRVFIGQNRKYVELYGKWPRSIRWFRRPLEIHPPQNWLSLILPVLSYLISLLPRCMEELNLIQKHHKCCQKTKDDLCALAMSRRPDRVGNAGHLLHFASQSMKSGPIESANRLQIPFFANAFHASWRLLCTYFLSFCSFYRNLRNEEQCTKQKETGARFIWVFYKPIHFSCASSATFFPSLFHPRGSFHSSKSERNFSAKMKVGHWGGYLSLLPFFILAKNSME